MNQSNHAIGIILRAAAFAADKHSTQRRKNVEASPYINHPISLASILANEGGVTDCEVLCAALLHDTIEDTVTSTEELKGIFGEEVTSIVQEVTDDKSLPKDVRKQLQIEHAFHLHPKAKLVKLADKISNLRDIATSPPAGWSEKRKDEYYEWARQVVDELRGIHPRLEAVFDDVYRARKR